MWDPPADTCFKTFFIESSFEPPAITGTYSGKPGILYEYTFLADDPDNLDVSYYIDWGNGANSGWLGPHPSGEKQIISHAWEEKGSYIIKAKAKNTESIETDWSTLEVTMPKNKAIDTPFLRFLENHPRMFPMLRHLLGL